MSHSLVLMRSLSLLSVPMVVIFKNLQTAATAYGDWHFFGKTVSAGTIACLVLMVCLRLILDSDR
jgi:glycopeptide antibiotics resistance protein